MYTKAMKTLARKTQTQEPIELPTSWKDSVQAVLKETYHSECEKAELDFDVIAATFPDELFICLSLFSVKNQELAPCTLMLSADIKESSAPEKLLKTLIDQAGVFFDTYFQTPEDQKYDLYQARWLAESHNSQEFFVKVSRENVRLTLEANKWL